MKLSLGHKFMKRKRKKRWSPSVTLLKMESIWLWPIRMKESIMDNTYRYVISKQVLDKNLKFDI